MFGTTRARSLLRFQWHSQFPNTVGWVRTRVCTIDQHKLIAICQHQYQFIGGTTKFVGWRARVRVRAGCARKCLCASAFEKNAHFEMRARNQLARFLSYQPQCARNGMLVQLFTGP